MRRVRRLLPAALVVLTVNRRGDSRPVACDHLERDGPSDHRVGFLRPELVSRRSFDRLPGCSDLLPGRTFLVTVCRGAVLPVLAGGPDARGVDRTAPRTRDLTLVVGIAAITAASFALSVWETYTAERRILRDADEGVGTRCWRLARSDGSSVTDRPAIPNSAELGRASDHRRECNDFQRGYGISGYLAAIPVIAAAVVISAGDVPGRMSTSWLTNRRTTQFLGDISYSILPLALAAYRAGAHGDSRR